MKKSHTAAPPPTPLRNGSDVAQQRPPPTPAVNGRVEKLSTEFAIGWATVSRSKHHTPVFATVDGEIIGFAVANISRLDLDRARQEGKMDAYGYIVIFDRRVPAEQVQSIKILIAGQSVILPQGSPVKTDRSPSLRLFLMGSPRSGTSQLARTLSKVLELPWLGEGHAAPLFASAAIALSGDADDKNGISRFMAHQGFRQIAIEAAKKAYFYLHGSASFVDKTPGVKMIGAATFLNECFPGSRFVFLWRNPVSNVLSRMAKFGGNFEAHCRDWAGAMNEWLRVRSLLPHYLEIQQEDMREIPDRVAQDIAEYIGIADCAVPISQSLKTESLESTGAGIGNADQLKSSWTPEQIATFDKICGPTMRAFENR
jgi:hypothetical protein